MTAKKNTESSELLSELLSEFALCKSEIKKFFNSQDFDKQLLETLIKETPVFINGVEEKKLESKENAFYEFWTFELLAQASAMFVKHNFSKIRYARKEKNIYSYNNIDSILNSEDEAVFKLAISHILSYWKMFFDIGQGEFRVYKAEVKKRNVENPKLKPKDDQYENCMSIVERIVRGGEKKSSAIFKSINRTEKDLQNEKRKFDSFCMNHKDEIRKKYKLTKRQFGYFLFPRTPLKKLFPQ